MVHFLHRPTCRPQTRHSPRFDATSQINPRQEAVRTFQSPTRTRHRTYLRIVKRASSTSIPSMDIDWIHIAKAESCLSGSKAAESCERDRFLCLLFESVAMSSVQPSNGSLTFLYFTGFISNKSTRE